MKIANVSGKFSVEYEVAKTPWKQMVGLSFSRRRRNMLFLFPFERSWEFWMFGMSYGLKIIFIDSKKCIIDIQEAVPMSLNPKTWKVYVPKKKCKYVLEVPIESRYNFSKGNRLRW